MYGSEIKLPYICFADTTTIIMRYVPLECDINIAVHTSKNGHLYFRWHDRHHYKGNFIVTNVVDIWEYLAAPIWFEYTETFAFSMFER